MAKSGWGREARNTCATTATGVARVTTTAQTRTGTSRRIPAHLAHIARPLPAEIRRFLGAGMPRRWGKIFLPAAVEGARGLDAGAVAAGRARVRHRPARAGRLRADRRGARARHPTAGHPGDRADRLRVDRGSAPRPGRGVRGAPRQADRPPDAGRGRAAPGLAPRGGLTLPTSRHTLLALP